MRLLLLLSLIIVLRCVIGQLTSTYVCPINSSNVTLQFSSTDHSARATSMNCSLSPCIETSVNNNSCLPSVVACYNYQTLNNTSYCAPGALCSLLEPCNFTGICSSGTYVCVVNSCCSTSAVCLPLFWTNLCSSTIAVTAGNQPTTSPLVTSTMVQRPPWPGTFAVAGHCVQSQCCCPTGNLVVTETTSTTLSISTTLSTTTLFSLGCFGFAGPYSFSVAYPAGYNMSVSLLGTSYIISLSSDGNTITLINTGNSACDESGTRIGAGR